MKYLPDFGTAVLQDIGATSFNLKIGESCPCSFVLYDDCIAVSISLSLFSMQPYVSGVYRQPHMITIECPVKRKPTKQQGEQLIKILKTQDFELYANQEKQYIEKDSGNTVTPCYPVSAIELGRTGTIGFAELARIEKAQAKRARKAQRGF